MLQTNVNQISFERVLIPAKVTKSCFSLLGILENLFSLLAYKTSLVSYESAIRSYQEFANRI